MRVKGHTRMLNGRPVKVRSYSRGTTRFPGAGRAKEYKVQWPSERGLARARRAASKYPRR